MDAVINELNMVSNYVINKLFNQCIDELYFIYDDLAEIKGLRLVREKVPIESVRNSPYWLIRMMQFADSRMFQLEQEDKKELYSYSYDKVWFDYANALREFKEPMHNIPFVYIVVSNEDYRRKLYETREMMWRESQKEKLLLLYGKVPTDVFNEILGYM